ncbi:MAG: hypothetical protein K6G89_03445 [Clostridia bacterium]|nr:hypothetical protein [Clostridia bacterium]
MPISNITVKRLDAFKEKIVITLSGKPSGPVSVSVFSPAVGERLLLGKNDVEAEDNKLVIDRYITGRDGAFLRYETPFEGPVFVSYVEPEFDYGYPEGLSKKGLQISDPVDAEVLGVKHTAINVAITDVMKKTPSDSTEPFEFDGHTYYVDMSEIRSYDERFREFTKRGILVNLILLCGKHWRQYVPEEMKPILLHPDYNDEGTLSAFNTVTDEGVRWYQAFVTYLAKRYGDPASTVGRIYGMIISNEVQSQWIWGNAGEKTCAEFAKHYTMAMRLAWVAASSVSSAIRIYASLDHFWGRAMDPSKPTRFYGALELLSEIRKLAKSEGDFYYNIAHHPYPQDLSMPDFWNDTTATDDDDTMRITFKNLEVLARFIYKEENLFEGRRRRIILSEQGFNSKWTPESEILQATAYGRAYRKVMEIPEIDSFILHAHRDNAEEFGLNLGVWRRKKDSNEIDAPKPIYYLMKAIDTVDDTGHFVWQRF